MNPDTNPRSPRQEAFDLVVIGTGVAGSSIAHTCRDAGWNVAILDSRPFGGTCALRGCDPKKVLVGAAETVDLARREAGLRHESGPEIDWPALIEFERSFTEGVPRAREKGFAERGIEALSGHGRFRRDGTLEVDGRLLSAPRFAIAAGSKPRTLGIPGEAHLTTSDEFLALRRLPPRIAFVGGGYIAFELAHVASRAGADVQLLIRGDQALRAFDPRLAARLVLKSRALGIEVGFNREARRIERAGDALRVVTAGEEGEQTSEVDLVVHGAGRVANLQGMGLEEVDVPYGDAGMEVDSHLRSVGNPAFFAAGDAAASGRPLTPKASHDARVVSANLIEEASVRVDYTGLPTTLFTIPPMASVGLQEEEAVARGLRFRVEEADTADWYHARRIREDTSAHRILLEEGSDRILGAHLLGPGSDELVNLFALAIQTDLRAPDLKSALFAYPTTASNLPSML